MPLDFMIWISPSSLPRSPNPLGGGRTLLIGRRFSYSPEGSHRPQSNDNGNNPSLGFERTQAKHDPGSALFPDPFARRLRTGSFLRVGPQARESGGERSVWIFSIAGELHAAGVDRFGQTAAHKAQGGGRSIALWFQGQGGRFTGKFLAPVQLQARLF